MVVEAERRKFWTIPETWVLVDAWRQDSIQKLLKGAKRNDIVYTKIVKSLAEKGFKRTADQCRAKIKALKKRYKGIRDKQRKSGEGRELDQDSVPADFPFYDAIDTVEGK